MRKPTWKLATGLAFALCAWAATIPGTATAVCPNEAFRNGPSAHLPDCRAYEMVSPVEKNGGYINTGSFSAAPGGEVIAFTSNAGFAGATSDIYVETGYQSSRTASGWTTVAETQEQSQFIDHHGILEGDFPLESFGNYETFTNPQAGQCNQSSAQVCTLEGGIRLWKLLEYSQPEVSTAFYRVGPDGQKVEVGSVFPPTASKVKELEPESKESENIKVLGWSADTAHVVYEDPEPAGPNQWSFGAPGALLEYSGIKNSAPMLVGVNDQGNFVNGCSRQLLGGSEGKLTYINNPISTDGARVFFTDACEGELFARIDNGTPDAHTVSISEPASEECVECDTEPKIRAQAEFLGASEDGTKAFFYTTQPLLHGRGGLFEYDFEAPAGDKILQISPGELPLIGNIEFGEGPHVLISEDGSHVYFLSREVLTQEPSRNAQGFGQQGQWVQEGAVAQSGANNVYVFERDGRYPAGHLAFVADLKFPPTSVHEGQGFSLTPDGRYLVLNVNSELTSDDTSEAIKQVFEYDALNGTMSRVSVGENGYNNDGNGVEAVIAGKPEYESTFQPSSYFKGATISADGAYVFFESPDGLTPQALNMAVIGKSFATANIGENLYANNVYEYHDGHVYLISDGQDISSHEGNSQVKLLTTDPSGRDVFFRTADQLVGQDQDSDVDIYDARVDGGFPSPAEPKTCTGDACQGGLSGAPALLSPGSEFQAGGNPPLASPINKAKVKAKAKKKAKSKKKAKKSKRAKAGRRSARRRK